ncbi:MAG: hypothetical protein CW346_12100 [Bacillaceae bacterium]|nr:hypothetical protein [Bacillaceae bacterium]
MPLWRPKAPEELSRGYAIAAQLAGERRRLVESWGDAAEAKQWAKVETYCRMMAEARMVDEPEGSRVNYDYIKEIPMDPFEIQKRIAAEVLWEHALGLDVVEHEDPRRPIEEWKRLALAAAMRVLSPRERVAVQMRYAWGLPHDLIAEAMGISEQALMVLLSRAKKKFAEISREAKWLSVSR